MGTLAAHQWLTDENMSFASGYTPRKPERQVRRALVALFTSIKMPRMAKGFHAMKKLRTVASKPWGVTKQRTVEFPTETACFCTHCWGPWHSHQGNRSD